MGVRKRICLLLVAYIAVERDNDLIFRQRILNIISDMSNKSRPVFLIEINDNVERDPFILLIDIEAVDLLDVLVIYDKLLDLISHVHKLLVRGVSGIKTYRCDKDPGILIDLGSDASCKRIDLIGGHSVIDFYMK